MKEDSFFFKSKEAQTAVDLFSIRSDLQAVIHSARSVCKIENSGNNDRSALIDSAMIRYRRCFGSGLRHHLTKADIERHAPSYISVHSYFIVMANKYVAHSVNGVEFAAPVVFTTENDTGYRDVVEVSIKRVVLLESNDNLQHLAEICEILVAELIDPELKRLHSVVEKQVKQLSQEQLRKLQRALFPVNPSPVELDKGRPRFSER